jgi:hypothetical protein
MGGTMTHINSISCGQGAPSLALIVMAGNGLFPAELVIVADTGWENDMLWSTGERTTAREFFERVTKPLAERYGMAAAFPRSLDHNGVPLDPIPVSISKKRLLAGTPEFPAKYYGIDIPMYGSELGRMTQSCTSKWKIAAIRQELRRRGADTATCAIGLHREEAHRVKPSDMQWVKHIWPLLDWGEDMHGDMHELGIGRDYTRQGAQDILTQVGVPYLVTTECDGCPHKDIKRWDRTSPETLVKLVEFEKQFNGELFLTEPRLPLLEGIEALRGKKRRAGKRGTGENLFDVCDSGYCFV